MENCADPALIFLGLEIFLPDPDRSFSRLPVLEKKDFQPEGDFFNLELDRLLLKKIN